VRPDQVVDFKALVGDSSDNIPGVKGIGEKTAVTLLGDHETLDGVYENLDDYTPGVRKKLEAGREEAYMSQELARIVTDLQIKLDIDRARPEAFDPLVVENLFRELEFRTLMSRLTALVRELGIQEAHAGEQLSMFGGPSRSAVQVISEPSVAEGTVIVDTTEQLEQMISRMRKSDMIAFDTETTSTDQMQAELVGISAAVEPGWGYYIPVGHTTGAKQLPTEAVLEALRGPFTDPGIRKAGHNLKYDYVMLLRYGLKAAPLSFDSMIAEWLINPSSRNLGLKNLAWVREGVQMTPIEELIGKGKKQITMAEVPIEMAAKYAAADAEVVLRLVSKLEHDLKERQAEGLFAEMEIPLISVLAEMEMAGIQLDSLYLEQMSAELAQSLEMIESNIYSMTGAPFNLNSPQQLSNALFNELGLEPPDRTRKTASGFYSTSASVLESMRGSHEVVDMVLEYRELAKLKSTYVDALPLQVNPQTGRVHTSYNQTGSRTGRIASSDPNLQNIPIRTDLGRRVRGAFVAAPGCRLLGVDYSQVELRIVAHMADDKAMIETFRAGKDIHAATAAAIYDIPLDEVTREQRRHAKAINFGLIYGMSAFGLTRTTDLTLAEAEDFVKAYFERFPGVKSYLDGMRRLAAQQGYVETLLGRRRYFPALHGGADYNVRMREEREAINAPIQGTAADIIKIAMLQVPDALRRAGLSARMLLQVHDELVLECSEEELLTTAQVVQDAMMGAYKLQVPLVTEARYGTNWEKMELI
jgi:DNA polymerase-1